MPSQPSTDFTDFADFTVARLRLDAPGVTPTILRPEQASCPGPLHGGPVPPPSPPEEEHMYDTPQENSRQAQDAQALAPPLRLAGIDEDDPLEPHVVRGID
ncbi:hypothetical protein [Streptomyces sp. Root1310]|uniref:hypothetical protein n=1 Tax=Streptomyces sp. Root1310 TaxID=1736452 RepID=UPI00071024D0|nr:hypothetical protein [Streptomyces sp. Root1310]KQX66445.1 hypothetical protein ASD48_41195 [Streptomyces sp. Root1310]